MPHSDVLWVGYFVVLLIHIEPKNRGRLGSAYFDPMKETVYILEDTEENNHFDLTTSSKSAAGTGSQSHSCIVLEQVAPDIVLTTSRSDGRFVDHVRLHSTFCFGYVSGVCVL